MIEGYCLFNVIISYDEVKVNLFICYFILMYGSINVVIIDFKFVFKIFVVEVMYGICVKDVFIKCVIW